jgi:hypothetical protein
MFTALDEQAAWAIWVCFVACQGIYKVIHSPLARLQEEVVEVIIEGRKCREIVVQLTIFIDLMMLSHIYLSE